MKIGVLANPKFRKIDELCSEILDAIGEDADIVVESSLASTLGIGVPFSVIPIAVLQGGLAFGAHWIEPVLTQGVITEITAVGGALILAIGLDVADIKRLPYGNMLPAVAIAGILGYFFG